MKQTIEKVALDFNLSKTLAKEVVDSVLESITDTIVSTGEIKLGKIGSLKIKQRAEKNGVNPKTKEKIVIPAKKALTFKAGKAMKELIQ